MNRERLKLKATKIVAGLICVGAALFACGILFWQTTEWLKTAYWHPYTITEAVRDWGFHYPYFPNLLGFQKIIDNVLTWPAVAVYVAVAFVAGFCWVHATESEAKLDTDEWLAKREKERAGKPETLAELAAEIEDLVGKEKR
jgi:hypothetical protein